MRLQSEIGNLKSEIRPGFTLVEMLVALALTVFMMAILSEAFVTGLKAMRDMKALGDMTERLRDAAAVIRRDLAANHFEGNRRLSELTVSGLPVPKNLHASPTDPLVFADYRVVSPAMGFFEIQEEPFTQAPPLNPTRVAEGFDSEGRLVERVYGNEMFFTVRLSGKDRNSVFDGYVFNNGNPLPTANPGGFFDINYGLSTLNFDSPLPNNRFMSNWAEIAYFMRLDRNRATAQSTGLADNANTLLVNTFTLHRRQLLLAPDAVPGDSSTATAVDGVNFPALPFNMTAFPAAQRSRYFYSLFDLSAALDVGSGNCYVNSPADVQLPDRRFSRRWIYGVAGPIAPFYGNRDPGAAGGGDPNNFGRLHPYIDNTARTGGDILLNNVISFDVKVWDPLALFQRVGGPGSAPVNPPVYRGAFVDIRHTVNDFSPTAAPYDRDVQVDGIYWGWNPNSCYVEDGPAATLPGDFNKRYFDTGTSRVTYAPPWPRQNVTAVGSHGPMAIPAIQITIRVWEPKTQQTRQITIVQDM